jgi:UPF0755 protein
VSPVRARREHWSVRALTRALAALLLAALGTLGWLVLVYPEREPAGRGHEVALTVAEGETLDALAARLAEEGVIDEPFLFATYARLLGASERLRTGEVLLRDDMPPRTVLLRVALGFGQAQVEVMIPEGLDHREIARRLDRWGVVAADEFVRAVHDEALLDELGIPRAEGVPASAEGYLQPDTYRLEERSAAADVVRRMVGNFHRRTTPLFDDAPGLAALADLGWSAHEVIVLASVVEEEAAVAEERPTIAGVFLNRLRSETFLPRHRLQADPTVSYGCRAVPERAPSCAGFDGRITRAMLDDAANPYNTYRHGELPPGPISNPGIAAIEAVLRAERHDYLYFVARGHGRHAFSADLAAHNAAVGRMRDAE